MVTPVTSSTSLSSGTATTRQQINSVNITSGRGNKNDSLELSAAATAKSSQAGGTRSTSSSTVASSTAVFDAYDINENGIVSLQELIAGLEAEASAAKEASGAKDESTQEAVRSRVQRAALYSPQGQANNDAVGTTVNTMA